MDNQIYNIEDLNEANDDSIRQIIAAAGSLPETDVPDGFHGEIMRSIRTEASINGAKKDKKGFPNNITKIFKPKYIYIAASAACILLVIVAVLPLLSSKRATESQLTGAAPMAPPMPAPAAAAPPSEPMAAAMPEDSSYKIYSNAGGGIDIGGLSDYDYGMQSARDMLPGATYDEEDAVAATAAQENEIAAGEAGRAAATIAADGLEGAASQSANEKQSLESQKIIKTAHYSIQVTDFDYTAAKIQQIAETAGGYVESFSSNIYNTYYSPQGGTSRDLKSGYICLRIPQNEYEYSKIKLENLGKITSTSESIDNITSRYIDTAARLDVKRTEEQRLLELYGKAEKIEDLISLETRLAYVRSDIESMMAQLQNWDRSVTFSTINISIDEVVDYSQLQTIDPTLGEKITEGFYRSAAAFTHSIERLIIKTAENSIAILVFFVIALVVFAVVNITIKNKLRKRSENDENENF